MAHHQQQKYLDNHTTRVVPVALSHDARHSEPLQMLEEEVVPDVDEPPDQTLMFKRQPIRSPALFIITDPMVDAIESTKQQSLLTQGLSKEAKSTTPRPRSVVSSYSNDSVASTTDLTSDGGLTSPARTTTPSPPLSLTIPNLGVFPPQLQKTETVIFAPQDPPRKRCITFACGKPPVKSVEVQVEKKVDTFQAKKPCMIKFACPAKPTEAKGEKKKVSETATAVPTSSSITEIPKKLTSKSSFSRSPAISKTKRRSDALCFHEFASKHFEDDEWVHENPRRLSKITISDTLRKENEYRKLGEEAAAEALEAEREEDEKAMDAEDDDDDNDFDEDLEDEDENRDDDGEDDDVDTDGNESDNEAGFAESDDDEVEDNSDYQFWTTGVTTAATSADYLEHIRSRNRSASASSIDSVIPSRSQNEKAPNPKLKKRHQRPKMRPATPELPDSTDFVCGTLDEDRPLEAAYLACIAQRKLAKQGILPQDLDPTFPTSDPEQDESEKEDDKQSVGSNDGTWAAGRFDDFDINNHRRGRQSKSCKQSPSVSPKRVKSPCPQPNRNRVLAHTPPPTRCLFGQSPKRNRSPATRSNPVSPPASRYPSYEDKSMDIPQLAQRPSTTQTKSLPRTPNPFWKQHRQQRKGLALPSDESNWEIHSRGPIDIVQGLEDKRRRRREKFWLTHYRKEAKEKEKGRRRQPPGRGAKRMRELGLEAADRCKGYGQRLQLVLSI